MAVSDAFAYALEGLREHVGMYHRGSPVGEHQFRVPARLAVPIEVEPLR